MVAVVRGARSLAWLALGWLSSGALHAQQEAAERPGPALDFEQASALLLQRSDAVRGDALGLQSAQAQQQAVQGLMLPAVSLDVLALRYQKTYDVSMHDLQQTGGSIAQQLLGGLPGVSPQQVTGVIESITQNLQQQLPGVFGALPRHIRTQFQQNLVSPNLSVVQPLYLGGAIRATQAAAEAATAAASAQGDAGLEQQRLGLVQSYFGQALAEQAVRVAQQDVVAYQHYLLDAQRLEQHGMLSHLRTMEVTVARDSALRRLLRAQGELRAARDSLALQLHEQGAIQLRTALFVNRLPVGPRADFVAAADTTQPRVRQAEAGVELARQATRLARSEFLPKLYAFGSYNLDRDHALPTQPDWVIGLGLHYTLNSPLDRRASLSAARAKQAQAEAKRDQLRQDLRTGVLRAYDLLDTSRLEYLSLASSQAAADENVRVHAAAFREGEDSVASLIAANDQRSQVQLQRAMAAYQYDLTLAGLLLASGQGEQFTDYLRRADQERVQ